MRTGRAHIVASACVIGLAALAAQCGSSSPPPPPAPAAKPAPPPLESVLSPTLTVKELMEHIIDPTADWVFDAAVVDVTAKGVVETKPLSDDDWLKVERGGLMLAESMNLLKMPRRMAPPVPPGQETAPHKGAEPELRPEQIQAKIDQDRMLWNKYADGLRDAALNSVKAARARDAEALFTVGSEIDRACENCHLEYWYPGDRKAVLEDQNKKVTYDPPKKADPAKKK